MPTQRLPTGIDMYYEVHGTGEPLVLVPSTAFAADVWMPEQVPVLSKSLQVIIFDPRGVGRTTHAGGVYTIEQQACDVYCLLEHLEIESAHVLGHSMGGRVALELALDFPSRVKSRIMAASGSGASTRPGARCVPGVAYSWIVGLREHDPETSHRHSFMETNNWFTEDFRQAHPEKVRAFADLALLRHAEWPEEVRIIMGRDSWEANHRLGDLAVPTLVLIGDRDTGNSNHWAQADELTARIAGAERRNLKGQSHGFFWQVPEETNAVILDWVSRHT